jgi:hypothetical protein
LTAQGVYIWYTERLWTLVGELPVKQVTISSIKEFEQNCWFHEDNPPTCKAVAEHARKINEADLSYPIILSAAGYLMDGGHRLAKAWLAGRTLIRAVQFSIDPEPDVRLAPGLTYTDWKRSRAVGPASG